MRGIVLVFVWWFSAVSVAQSQSSLSGRLEDGATLQALPYAGLQLWPSQRGTITNEGGFFVLQPLAGDDSLFISLVGYKSVRMALADFPADGKLQLQALVRTLAEVAVRPEDDSWLYALLPNLHLGENTALESRAYYELKSKIGDKQVELVEAFYNLTTKKGEVTSMALKAGRLALQPVGQRLFANTEGARALASMPLFKTHPYFPGSPLTLSRRALQRRYALYDLGGYRLESGDSVQVVRFVPKEDRDAWFEGELGILMGDQRLLFLELRIARTRKHPFVPMGPDDRLDHVALHLKRSFLPHASGMRLEKLEMAYAVTYTNGRGQVYPVESKAFLYSYAPNRPFYIWNRPGANSAQLSDYLRINSLPYQAAFWESGPETRMEDVQGQNQAYFKDRNSLTNVNLFTNQPLLGNGLLQRPFTHWDGKRLLFNGETQRPPNESGKREVRVDDFHLQVDVFFDLNQLADTLHWQTATIFDPYASYFYLPIAAKEQCFINLYFDVMECERRRLEGMLLQSEKTEAALLATYQTFQMSLETKRQQFFRDTMLGNSRKGMERWNAVVKSTLGIDNLQHFGLLE